jgi:hypothetical protein
MSSTNNSKFEWLLNGSIWSLKMKLSSKAKFRDRNDYFATAMHRRSTGCFVWSFSKWFTRCRPWLWNLAGEGDFAAWFGGHDARSHCAGRARHIHARDQSASFWHGPMLLNYTPSGSLLEVVLDKVWIKHWEYKSWITFKPLSLKMWKSYK